MSLARKAWIEIYLPYALLRFPWMSLARKAWIEIYQYLLL